MPRPKSPKRKEQEEFYAKLAEDSERRHAALMEELRAIREELRRKAEPKDGIIQTVEEKSAIQGG